MGHRKDAKYQYTNYEIFTANLDCCVLFFPEASVRCTCSAHAHAVCYWFLCLITSNPVSFGAEDAGFRVYGTRGCSKAVIKPDAVDAPSYPNTSTPNVSSYFFMQRMFVTILIYNQISAQLFGKPTLRFPSDAGELGSNPLGGALWDVQELTVPLAEFWVILNGDLVMEFPSTCP